MPTDLPVTCRVKLRPPRQMTYVSVKFSKYDVDVSPAINPLLRKFSTPSPSSIPMMLSSTTRPPPSEWPTTLGPTRDASDSFLQR